MRERMRRLLRRAVVFALDGQPALLAELIEMKDRIDDGLGSLDDRIDDLERDHVTQDDVDRSIEEFSYDLEFAASDHDHDGTYACEDHDHEEFEQIEARLKALEGRTA